MIRKTSEKSRSSDFQGGIELIRSYILESERIQEDAVVKVDRYTNVKYERKIGKKKKRDFKTFGDKSSIARKEF